MQFYQKRHYVIETFLYGPFKHHIQIIFSFRMISNTLISNCQVPSLFDSVVIRYACWVMFGNRNYDTQILQLADYNL